MRTKLRTYIYALLELVLNLLGSTDSTTIQRIRRPVHCVVAVACRLSSRTANQHVQRHGGSKADPDLSVAVRDLSDGTVGCVRGRFDWDSLCVGGRNGTFHTDVPGNGWRTLDATVCCAYRRVAE